MSRVAALKKTVANALDGAGDLARAATLTRVEGGSFDPVTDSFAASPARTTMTATGKVVTESISRRYAEVIEIRDGDRQFLAGKFAIRPQKGDTLAVGDQSFTILYVDDVLDAGGLYRLVAR